MPLRWWTLLLLTAFLPVALLWFAFQRVLLADATARAEQIAQQLEAQSGSRPALGPLDQRRADSAWEHYAEALAIPEQAEDRGERAAALLRRAAACTDARCPGVRLREGFFSEAPDVIGLLDLARAMLAHARALQDAGEVKAALRAELDVAALGRDLAAAGTLVSWCAGCLVLDEALDAVAAAPLRRLARAEVWAVALDLERLEGVMPALAEPLQCEMVGVTFSAADMMEESGMSMTDRVLFELLAGTTVAHYQDCSSELIATEAMAWPQAVAHAQAAVDRMLRSHNPMDRMFVPRGAPQILEHGRRAQARIRALREVLQWLALGYRLELDDPFGGGRLTFAVDHDGVIRCASVGPRADQPIEIVVR